MYIGYPSCYTLSKHAKKPMAKGFKRYCTLERYSRHQKKLPVPFRFSSRFCRSVQFRSFLFTSVLTVCRGQTVLALGMNSSAKFTACVGEALRDYFQRLDQEVVFSYLRRATGSALSRSSLLGCVRGPGETGALALTCIFYASL